MLQSAARLKIRGELEFAISRRIEDAHAAVDILLVGDHPVLRAGLGRLLGQEPGFRILGEAAREEDAIRLAAALNPDILILDASMAGLISGDLLGRITGSGLNTRTLLLAVAEDEALIAEAWLRGIRGVVYKRSSATLLIRAIRSLMEGKTWLVEAPVACRGNTAPAPGKAEAVPRMFGLTGREREIVSGVVSGYSNKEIAAKLAISIETVKHHLTNTFDKTGVSNRLELALFAMYHGLVRRA